MSLIKPFSGIRPKKKFAKQITSPNSSYINNFKLTKELNFLNDSLALNKMKDAYQVLITKCQGKNVSKNIAIDMFKTIESFQK